MNHWRAGCAERRTSGSEGGGWKRAVRRTAPRWPPTLPRPLPHAPLPGWRLPSETTARGRGQTEATEGRARAMKPIDRQRALYGEFVPPRTDGGKPFTLEDHI